MSLITVIINANLLVENICGPVLNQPLKIWLSWSPTSTLTEPIFVSNKYPKNKTTTTFCNLQTDSFVLGLEELAG